jgi:hypothetical protein
MKALLRKFLTSTGTRFGVALLERFDPLETHRRQSLESTEREIVSEIAGDCWLKLQDRMPEPVRHPSARG